MTTSISCVQIIYNVWAFLRQQIFISHCGSCDSDADRLDVTAEL